MAKPIEISFTADTREVIRGAGDIGEAFDDVADSLRDLADDGDRAGSDLGDGLQDGARDGEKALGDLEKAIQEAQQDAEKLGTEGADALDQLGAASRKAGQETGDGVGDGFSRAGAATDEFRDEAKANISETFSSFRGDVEDIPQLVQDVFGGVAPAFGGLGLALTAGLAAGIGVAIGKAQELAEENTEAQGSVADLAGEFIEFGATVDRLGIAEKIKSWGLEVNEDNWVTFWVDEAETNFQKYGDLAEEAGVRTQDAIRGMKGSYEDSQTFLNATTEARQALTQAIEEGTRQDSDGVEIMDASAVAASKKRDALDELRQEARDNSEAHREAAEIEDIYRESVEGSADELERKTELLNEQADILDQAITSELDYQEAVDETSETIKDNGKTLDTTTEKGRENWRALQDLATASRDFRDAQAEAGIPADQLNALMVTQRDKFMASAQAAGMNKQEAAALADQLGLVPTDIHTDFTETGSRDVKQKANDLENTPDIPIAVNFKPDTSEVTAAEWWMTRNPVTRKVYFQPINNMLNRSWN